ncbi:hypothetical protein L1987_70728 [Smallanthus sonchifolius]|uniref:Uncharacterized protein n=1 Tax=Smallanthus sonchifolius TaxID=185202 RepID=A0ACB9ARA3_9ASTR|nr:hypothetical protein L1987_70728 [Smallanthus sonchifolius]
MHPYRRTTTAMVAPTILVGPAFTGKDKIVAELHPYAPPSCCRRYATPVTTTVEPCITPGHPGTTPVAPSQLILNTSTPAAVATTLHRRSLLRCFTVEHHRVLP